MAGQESGEEDGGALSLAREYLMEQAALCPQMRTLGTDSTLFHEEMLAFSDALSSIHSTVHELVMAQTAGFLAEGITLDTLANSVQNTVLLLEDAKADGSIPPLDDVISSIQNTVLMLEDAKVDGSIPPLDDVISSIQSAAHELEAAEIDMPPLDAVVCSLHDAVEGLEAVEMAPFLAKDLTLDVLTASLNNAAGELEKAGAGAFSGDVLANELPESLQEEESKTVDQEVLACYSDAFEDLKKEMARLNPENPRQWAANYLLSKVEDAEVKQKFARALQIFSGVALRKSENNSLLNVEAAKNMELKLKKDFLESNQIGDVETWILDYLLASSPSPNDSHAHQKREALRKKHTIQQKMEENVRLKELKNVYQELVDVLKINCPSDHQSFVLDHLCKLSKKTVDEQRRLAGQLRAKREIQSLRKERQVLEEAFRAKSAKVARNLLVQTNPEVRPLLGKYESRQALQAERAQLQQIFEAKTRQLKKLQNSELNALVSSIHLASHELEALERNDVLSAGTSPHLLDEAVSPIHNAVEMLEASSAPGELLHKKGIRLADKMAIVKLYKQHSDEISHQRRLRITAFLPREGRQLRCTDCLLKEETYEQAWPRILSTLGLVGPPGAEQLVLAAVPAMPRMALGMFRSVGLAYLEDLAHSFLRQQQAQEAEARANAEAAEKERQAQVLRLASGYLGEQVRCSLQTQIYEEVDRLGRTVEIQTTPLHTPRGSLLLGDLFPQSEETELVVPRFRVKDSLMGGLRLEEVNPPSPRALPSEAADSVFGLLSKIDPFGSPRLDLEGEVPRPMTAPVPAHGVEDRRHRTRTWLKDVSVARRLEQKNATLLMEKKHREEMQHLEQQNHAHSNQVLDYLFTHENSLNLVTEMLATGSEKATTQFIVNDPFNVVSDHLIHEISGVKSTETIEEASDRAISKMLEQRAAAMIVGASFLEAAVTDGVNNLLTVQISAEKKAVVARRHAQSYLSSVVGNFIKDHREELQIKDHLAMFDARAYLQRQALSVAAALQDHQSKVDRLVKTYLSTSANEAAVHASQLRLRAKEEKIAQLSAQQALGEVSRSLWVPLLTQPPVTQVMLDRMAMSQSTASSKRCRTYSSNTTFVPGWPLVGEHEMGEDNLEDESLITMYPWEHPDNQEFAKGEWTAFDDDLPAALPSESFLMDPIPEGISVRRKSSQHSGFPTTADGVKSSANSGRGSSKYSTCPSSSMTQEGFYIDDGHDTVSQATRSESQDLNGGVYISPRIYEALRQTGMQNQTQAEEAEQSPAMSVSLPNDTLGKMSDFDDATVFPSPSEKSPPPSHLSPRARVSPRDRMRTDESDLIGLQYAQTSATPTRDSYSYTQTVDWEKRAPSPLAPLTPPGGRLRVLQQMASEKRNSQSLNALSPLKESARSHFGADTYSQRNAELMAMTEKELGERRKAKEVFVKTLPTVTSAAGKSMQLRESSLAAFRQKGYGGASSKYIQYWEAKLQRSRAYYTTKTALNKAVGTICKTRGSEVTQEAAFCALAEADGIVGEAFSHLLNPDFLKEVDVVCKIINVSEYMRITEYQNFLDPHGVEHRGSLPPVKMKKTGKQHKLFKSKATQSTPETKYRKARPNANASTFPTHESYLPPVKSKQELHKLKQKKLHAAYQVEGLNELKQQIKASKRLANPKYKGMKKNNIDQMIEDEMIRKSIAGV